MKRSFAIACVFLIMLIIIFLPTGNYVLQESLYLQEQKINTVKYTIVTNPDSDEDSDVLREENPYEVADVTQGGIGGGSYDWESDEDAPQWGNDTPDPESLKPSAYFDLPVQGLNEVGASFSMAQNWYTPTPPYGMHQAWDFGRSSTYNASGGAISIVTAAKPGRIAYVRNGKGMLDSTGKFTLRDKGTTIEGSFLPGGVPLAWSGNVVVIAHDDGTRSCYAHLVYEENYPLKMGDTVVAGHPLGRMGNTGRSDGAHLHWEIKAHPHGKVTSMDKVAFANLSTSLRSYFGNSSDWEITPKVKWKLSHIKDSDTPTMIVAAGTRYYVRGLK